MPVPYVAPLCPAGRLPLKGGHGLAFLVSPFSNVVGSCATPKLPISPFEAGQSRTAVRANFLLSVSGCALNTSPPKGVEEVRELAATGALPRPLQGERCRARRARRRGGKSVRKHPYAIALPSRGEIGSFGVAHEFRNVGELRNQKCQPISPLEGEMSGRTEGGARGRGLAVVSVYFDAGAVS